MCSPSCDDYIRPHLLEMNSLLNGFLGSRQSLPHKRCKPLCRKYWSQECCVPAQLHLHTFGHSPPPGFVLKQNISHTTCCVTNPLTPLVSPIPSHPWCHHQYPHTHGVTNTLHPWCHQYPHTHGVTTNTLTPMVSPIYPYLHGITNLPCHPPSSSLSIPYIELPPYKAQYPQNGPSMHNDSET